ncbi:MAG: hypothetical protein HY683_04305 [Chloroflexi bacterium]|nr:hypothetical protein [Chloroflexota bacterium]
MSALTQALQSEQWEVAAYLLLIGLARLASQVPPETLEDLLHLLEEGGHGVQ